MNSNPPPVLDPVVIVLAAGKGTRMNSDLPKVLCPVVDRAMIHFVLDATDQGRHRQEEWSLLVTKPISFARNSTRVANPISFMPCKASNLGTGHAVQMCLEHLEGHMTV